MKTYKVLKATTFLGNAYQVNETLRFDEEAIEVANQATLDALVKDGHIVEA